MTNAGETWGLVLLLQASNTMLAWLLWYTKGGTGYRGH